MKLNVIKRNGGEVEFNPEKIRVAIEKANSATQESERIGEDRIGVITATVCAECEAYGGRAVSVEEIQDLVEEALMKEGAYKLAHNYISYRYERAMVRKANTTDEKILSLVSRQNEEAKQENSNKNPIINSTQRDYIAGEVSRDLTERILLPKDVVEAHKEGIIHFHDSDYFLQPMHNCFSSDTAFVTDKGIRTFRNFRNGDKVTILDKNGKWREATVRSYGKSRLNSVTLREKRRCETVRCTSNHRWILKDGTVTTSLETSDRLATLNEIEPFEIDEEMFCLGFIIGDGSDGENRMVVRLRGSKTQYANHFEKIGYHKESVMKNGDIRMTRQGSPLKRRFLQSHGWEFLSLQEKQSLFMGLYAADGAIGSNRLSTSDENVAQMVREISCVAGYHVSSEKKLTHDTNYKKGAILYDFHFVRYQRSNSPWIVADIDSKKDYHEYEVWCVEEPVTHSFTLAGGIVTGNCCLVNLEDMLQNGTVISGTKIEKPHSFATACNIATQVIAQVASNQYGGQTITLSHLAPFVDISRQKHRKNVKEELLENGFEATDAKVNAIAEKRLRKEVTAGVQTIQYQIITLLSTNGQAPFVTVFMYLDEVPEGQMRNDLAMIIEEVLKQRIQGVKNKAGVWVTPAFPKLIYALDEDNISEDSKYWYLTELAAKCTAKRMVPDYISVKKMKELKGDVYPCMGCVSGDGLIDYKINDNRYVENFEHAWNRLSRIFNVKIQPNGRDLYMDTPMVSIWDSKEKSYVKQLRIIRNNQSKWYRIFFTGGRFVTVTDNHPFEIDGKGVVLAKDLVVGDSLGRNVTCVMPQFVNRDDDAWLSGLIICDGCYSSQINISLGLDENDIVNHAKEVLLKQGYNPYVTQQRRGDRGDYQELKIHGSGNLQQICVNNYEGVRKIDRKIPFAIFNGTFAQKASFIAGMIDADGYVNNNGRSIKVQLGSTNEELALQQMQLAIDIGLNASVYRNYYKHSSSNIRYRVEFDCPEFLASLLVSEKKKRHFDENHKFYKNVMKNSSVCSVKEIIPFEEDMYSYDVTTESEHFSVNGIYSHNCRSFLTPDRFTDVGVGNVAHAMNYKPDEHKYYGRFNQGVVTINLVDIACSSKKDMDAFWKIFDERLGLCYKALMCRHKALLGTPSDVAPILWQDGALARLKPGEVIDPLLFNGYSTISLGYGGLAECVYYMIGKSHTTEEGRKFGLAVMQHLNDACNKWKAETNIDFSVYGTPMESTTYKFAKCLQKRFGIIPHVTDKNYITNSYHVHVTEEINAFDKLTKESQFQQLSPGGAISYVEVPNMQNNIPAVLALMKHIYNTILYAELNTKSDYCMNCGYDGEIQIVQDEHKKLIWRCPCCGNTDQTKMSVARRTCGYIGTQFWNQGRTQEISERCLHL